MFDVKSALYLKCMYGHSGNCYKALLEEWFGSLEMLSNIEDRQSRPDIVPASAP